MAMTPATNRYQWAVVQGHSVSRKHNPIGLWDTGFDLNEYSAGRFVDSAAPEEPRFC